VKVWIAIEGLAIGLCLGGWEGESPPPTGLPGLMRTHQQCRPFYYFDDS
jgi:hypothetical protein